MLVGRRQLRSMNSWLHNLPKLASGRDRCELLVHPEDARALGLAEGMRARVRSASGSVEAPVRTSDEMMRGVVSLPHGHGHADPEVGLSVATAAQPGVNANALTDEHGLDVLSGTSVANGIPVSIEPV